ncbi:Uncharacterised protein [Acinetobacter baumannii]|nr:hypothetical protein [Acinetobacter baumannii]MDV4251109.1 hypothetical protein [Acinetobacter baumannii]MDV4290203.1 hypothetical protein [Acinetobacter baumannii]SSS36834.1 Uncharacterised protein [Acinetobacter baumannii]
MDSRWIEAQRREMEKLISPELIKSRDLARSMTHATIMTVLQLSKHGP